MGRQHGRRRQRRHPRPGRRPAAGSCGRRGSRRERAHRPGARRPGVHRRTRSRRRRSPPMAEKRLVSARRHRDTQMTRPVQPPGSPGGPHVADDAASRSHSAGRRCPPLHPLVSETRLLDGERSQRRESVSAPASGRPPAARRAPRATAPARRAAGASDVPGHAPAAALPFCSNRVVAAMRPSAAAAAVVPAPAPGWQQREGPRWRQARHHRERHQQRRRGDVIHVNQACAGSRCR